MPPPMYLDRARPFERATAEGIDVLLAVFPAAVVHSMSLAWMDAADIEAPAARYGLGVLRYLVAFAYTLFFEGFRGTSPGKMAVGLVIALHDGVPADRWTLVFRWMTKQYDRIWLLVGAAILIRPVATMSGLVAAFATTVLTIGLFQALDEDRRTWHDQWTGTAVWKKRKKPPLPERRPRPDWLPPEVEMQWPAQPGAR